ncbi:MAG: GTPase HflX, partial [Deltaproteobacteria bacterium]|nr:GTPase HflX [Deltaproteobacteria bacterium]
ESQDADLLLHIIDASDPCRNEHVETTEKLLVDLGLERVPRILVFNKCDRLEAPAATIQNRGIAIIAIAPSSLGVLRVEIDKRIAVSNPLAKTSEPTSSRLV